MIAAVGVFVGPEPERLNARHPGLVGTTHVLVEAVAHEERFLRNDPERVQCPLEDLGVGLALPELGREDREVDPLGDPELLEVAMEKRPGVERVRDEPELQSPAPESLEERMRRPAKNP